MFSWQGMVAIYCHPMKSWRYDHIGKLDYVHTGVLTPPDDYPIFD